jgi:hypothetical protein
MTTDELRAAAERVRRFRRGENPCDIWEYPELDQYHDLAQLAAAWLADHPADDDTGLSVGWMHSVGFVQSGGGWWARVDGSDGLALEYYDSNEVGEVFRLPTNGYLPSRVLVNTRGDLRRLCRALGQPLIEPATTLEVAR